MERSHTVRKRDHVAILVSLSLSIGRPLIRALTIGDFFSFAIYFVVCIDAFSVSLASPDSKGFGPRTLAMSWLMSSFG